jgi:hypothetical protein
MWNGIERFGMQTCRTVDPLAAHDTTTAHRFIDTIARLLESEKDAKEILL